MPMRLGEILVRGGVILEEQLEAALQAQSIYGGRLGTNLVEQGFIELDPLTLALSQQLGVPAALQKQLIAIAPAVAALIPAKMAEKHRGVPVELVTHPIRRLQVAFIDPRTLAAVDELGFIASARVVPMVAPELRILYLLEKHYGVLRHNRFLRIQPMGHELTGIMPDSPELIEQLGSSREARRVRPLPEADPATPSNEPDTLPIALAPSGDLLPPLPPVGQKPAPLRRSDTSPAGFSMPEAEEGDSLFASLAPPVDRPPALSAADAMVRVAQAASRDEIADGLVDFLRGAFACGLVLICKESMALGWRGFAPGTDAPIIESIAIPLQAPSMFGIPYETREALFGAPPPGGAALQNRLWKLLRLPAPQEVIVVPISIKERVVALVYGQTSDGKVPPGPAGELQSVCAAAGTGFLGLIQRNRQK